MSEDDPVGDAEHEPGTYRTVAGPSEAGFEVRGSSFVGHVAPVEDVEAAEAFIEAVAGRHPDATHTVPAYRVRAGGGGDPGLLREWSNDGGEPAGSAGKPALNVLVKRDLENVAAVVTRRFGGTELGVGGLARAYGRAVSLSVEAAGVVERGPHRRIVVEVSYGDSGTVRGLLESADVAFEATYQETAVFDVRVPVDEVDGLVERVKSATRGRASVDGDGP